MTARSRTQPCTRENAKQRLADARAQMDLAGLATAESTAAERKAAVACACTAAIAAADAASCAAVSAEKLEIAQRNARALIAFAEEVLAR